MENNNLTAVNEIYRNAKTALLAIESVLPTVDNADLYKEITSQKQGYEEILADITLYMKDNNFTPVEVNAFKKMGMNMGIKMNTAFNNSTSHVAEIMIKGTVAGISELVRILNDANNKFDEKIISLADKLKRHEENCEESLKKFL
jgi:hypothetical protein